MMHGRWGLLVPTVAFCLLVLLGKSHASTLESRNTDALGQTLQASSEGPPPPLPPKRPNSQPKVSAKPPRERFDTPERPKTVFRGDNRSPNEIQSNGGFLPRNPSDSPEAYRLYPVQRFMSDVTFKNLESIYISTSHYFSKAESYPQSTSNTGNDFVYVIRATENMVDMDRSVGQYIEVDNAEFPAVGGIRWDQVIGWIQKSEIPRHDRPSLEFTNDKYDKLLTEGKIQMNMEYNTKYDHHAASAGQPQLVGFPEGHPAWEQEPWSAFKSSLGKSTKDYIMEFMNSVGEVVGWSGQFPLIDSPRAATVANPPPTGLPKILYRSDTRTPKMITADGGFQPWGPLMEDESGFSVARHLNGVGAAGISPPNSVYVAATDDAAAAARFLRGYEGYVYKIRATPNIFSVQDTLGDYYTANGIQVPIQDQREFVAMGGVLWNQVMEYALVEGSSGVVDPHAQFRFNWVKNPDYNLDTPEYEGLTASEGRPELAGFDEVPGHQGQHDDFYHRFTKQGGGKSLKEWGFDFLAERRQVTKWAGQVPFTPYPKGFIAKAAKLVEKASKAAKNAADQSRDPTRSGQVYRLATEVDKALKEAVGLCKKAARTVDYYDDLSVDTFNELIEKMHEIRAAATQVDMATIGWLIWGLGRNIYMASLNADSTNDGEEIEKQYSIAKAALNQLKQQVKRAQDKNAGIRDRRRETNNVLEKVWGGSAAAKELVQKALTKFDLIWMPLREDGVDAVSRERDAIIREALVANENVQKYESTLATAKTNAEKAETTLQNHGIQHEKAMAEAAEQKAEMLKSKTLVHIYHMQQTHGIPTWLEGVLIAGSVALAALGGVGFLAMAGGLGALAGGAAAVAEGTSIMAAEGMAVTAAESVVEVSTAEVTSVVAEVDTDMAAQILLESAPNVLTTAIGDEGAAVAVGEALPASRRLRRRQSPSAQGQSRPEVVGELKVIYNHALREVYKRALERVLEQIESVQHNETRQREGYIPDSVDNSGNSQWV